MLEIADLVIDWPEMSCRYDLTVPRHSLCAIVGPSGGGKTTLINAIAGFGRPPEGTLRFDGQDLLKLPPDQRPVSILFQEHNLFPHLTAAQNIGLGLDPGLHLDAAQSGTIEDALRQVGLSGMGHRFPAELSGGQRQRVALARALVRRRPLVLLDEPFAALDPALRQGMIELVDELRRSVGLTVLMSIHTPADLAERADMLVTIDGGRVTGITRRETD